MATADEVAGQVRGRDVVECLVSIRQVDAEVAAVAEGVVRERQGSALYCQVHSPRVNASVWMPDQVKQALKNRPSNWAMRWATGILPANRA